MNTVHIAFLGFGEVAAVFSEAVSNHGARVCAYDILLGQENGLETLYRRARVPDISFLPIADVLKDADLVLSTVTTHVALEAAGAQFVEGAILGAIGVTGAETKILIGGAKGRETAETLSQLGLHAVFYSPDIGKASSFKMLRSVFSKGVEALLIEFLVAGKRAGIENDLWAEITELFELNSFDRVAANWIQTHATAHERRYHEMKQVSDVLREMGLDPLLTSGTEAFFERSCNMGMKEAFTAKPDDMEDVIEFMEKHL